MILKRKNGLLFFQFPNLVKYSGISHAIFTRVGGFSRDNFKGLNSGKGVGDDEENVDMNRSLISRCMGNELVFVRQVHGDQVIECSDTRSLPVTGDAQVTKIPEKMLVIQTADCQSVMMYDPVRCVVANVHSGWKGSISDIAGNTANFMKKEFGSAGSDIIAGIGPSLGPCCAEFINYKNEIPAEFLKYKNDSDHFDFWSITKDQLCNAGLISRNIHTSQICTKCNTSLFFSYRSKHVTGRFASVIGIG